MSLPIERGYQKAPISPLAQPLLRKPLMNVSMSQAAAAMNANARWQEIIADNLVSSSSTAYKKQELSFEAIQGGLLSPASGGSAIPSSLPIGAAYTNFHPGELKPTGIPTDLAIDGSAFFHVQLPDGSIGYTRNGNLSLSPQGQLITKEGYPLLGEAGPLQLDTASSAPISVAPDGSVSQGSEVRGKLKLSSFQNPGRLSAVGAGLYKVTDPGMAAEPASAAAVRQGFLESSNVAPFSEMTNLVSALRSYEANQRVIQSQDERMGRLISELGNPS